MSIYEQNVEKIKELLPEKQWAAQMWLNQCWNLNYQFRITEAYRTTERQKALYAQGRTTPGPIVTYLDGVKNKSKHQERLAVDVYPIKCGYADIEHVAAGWGITHPFVRGDFLDLPHFELSGAMTMPKPLSPSAAKRKLAREIKQAQSPRKERLQARLDELR